MSWFRNLAAFAVAITAFAVGGVATNFALQFKAFSNVMDPEDYENFPSFDADPNLRKWNLWGYIDGRDGAQAVARALEYGRPGFEAFIIANEDSVMTRSSASLAAEVFPDVKVTRELGEHETMLSIDKARRLLGFAPEHSWRTYHSNRTTPTED